MAKNGLKGQQEVEVSYVSYETLSDKEHCIS